MKRFISTVRGRQVVNYQWTRSKGLQCEMFPGLWVKSAYTLPEFLSGMNGSFKEV